MVSEAVLDDAVQSIVLARRSQMGSGKMGETADSTQKTRGCEAMRELGECRRAP
jgi:hypothetical protein